MDNSPILDLFLSVPEHNFSIDLNPLDAYLEAYACRMDGRSRSLGNTMLPDPFDTVFSYVSSSRLGVEVATSIELNRKIHKLSDDAFEYLPLFPKIRRMTMEKGFTAFEITPPSGAVKRMDLEVIHSKKYNSLTLTFSSNHQGFTSAQRIYYDQVQGGFNYENHLKIFSEELLAHSVFAKDFINCLIADTRELSLTQEDTKVPLPFTYTPGQPFLLKSSPIPPHILRC